MTVPWSAVLETGRPHISHGARRSWPHGAVTAAGAV